MFLWLFEGLLWDLKWFWPVLVVSFSPKKDPSLTWLRSIRKSEIWDYAVLVQKRRASLFSVLHIDGSLETFWSSLLGWRFVQKTKMTAEILTVLGFSKTPPSCKTSKNFPKLGLAFHQNTPQKKIHQIVGRPRLRLKLAKNHQKISKNHQKISKNHPEDQQKSPRKSTKNHQKIDQKPGKSSPPTILDLSFSPLLWAEAWRVACSVWWSHPPSIAGALGLKQLVEPQTFRFRTSSKLPILGVLKTPKTRFFCKQRYLSAAFEKQLLLQGEQSIRKRAYLRELHVGSTTFAEKTAPNLCAFRWDSKLKWSFAVAIAMGVETFTHWVEVKHLSAKMWSPFPDLSHLSRPLWSGVQWALFL